MRSRSRRPNAPRRRVTAVACLVVAVSLLLLSTPSSSAPGDPPGEEDLPDYTQIALSRGTVASTQGAVVRRSKMYITVRPDDPIWGVFYNNMFNTPAEAPTHFQGGLCTRGRPCIANPFEQPPCATSDIGTQWRGGYYRYLLYPVKPLSSGGVDVGGLAEVPVNLVAFGSIPAQATIVLRSPRVDGKVSPLRIHLWSISANLGCELPPVDKQVHTLVEGKVEIRIKNLKVDGTPVDIGNNCRSVRPADLALWGESGEGGYFPLTGGNLGAFDGLHGGSLGPLRSPYYQSDEGRVLKPSTGMTVPAFSGCRAGGEDLSPLVTAMASGPNNPVRVKQGTVIVPMSGIDLNNLGTCNEQGQCPLPAPDTPERPPLPGDE